MTSLVDILLATIGIFVIFLALVEISEPVTRVPAPYDGMVVCGAEGRLETLALDGTRADLDAADPAGALLARFP